MVLLGTRHIQLHVLQRPRPNDSCMLLPDIPETVQPVAMSHTLAMG